MAYSRNKRDRDKVPDKRIWPDLRYGPEGQVKLFYSAEDVPEGWTTRHPSTTDTKVVVKAPKPLDRDELVAILTERNIYVDPTWCNAHMKRIVDSDIRPTR